MTKAFTWWTGALSALVTTAAVIGSTVVPEAGDAEPHDYLDHEIGIGDFHLTFEQDLDWVLPVRDDAQNVCVHSPDGPIHAEPRPARLRVYCCVSFTFRSP